MLRTRLRRLVSAAILLCLFAAVHSADAYSLLTHEQLVDLTWQSTIVPLLLSRYPTLTPAQIEHARAYAYGGCVIQDIGYYPFGDTFFSDLTHYVRSGDFVVNLFRNAGNADELAFAVGALSHYIGDTIGHAQATNLAVPVEFPRLRARYGDTVSYAQGEHQHVQTEFAFDVDQVAHHRLAPVHYLRHIGLEVPTRQVSLAFYQTYGLREDLAGHRAARINVGTYNFAVHRFIPRVAYAVTLLHRRHEPAEIPSPELQRLTDAIARVAQENQWDRYRKKAGLGTYTLAGLLSILPPIGPFKLVDVKGPTAQTEADYVHSVLASADALDVALRRFTPPPPTKSTAAKASVGDKAANSPPARPAKAGPSPAEVRDPLHPLPNLDLDTGLVVQPTAYRLTDDTYAALLHRIALAPKEPIPPGIKSDILAYYANLNLPFATKRKPERWAAVQIDLVTLKSIPTSTELDPFPTYDEVVPTP
jgi:hypothetical protein